MTIRNILRAAFVAALASPAYADDENNRVIDLCGKDRLCTYYKTDLGTFIKTKESNGAPDHASRILINAFERKMQEGMNENSIEANHEQRRIFEPGFAFVG